MVSKLERSKLARSFLDVPIWVWLLLFNLFLLLNTAIYPYVRNEFVKWIIVNHFNLAGEMAIGAWWAGALLLLVALLAVNEATGDDGTSYPWLILGVLFALLSFDEIGSLHERLSMSEEGATVLLVLGAIGSVAFLFACQQLWLRDRRRVAVWLFAGMALMGSAVVHEYFEHRVNWPYALQGLRAAFEEGSELTGTLFCVIALTGNRGLRELAERVKAQRKALISWRQLIMAAGAVFALHLLTSVWVVRYVELELRGNPAVWYFVAVFLLLSLAHLQQALVAGSGSRATLNLILAAYFLALSVGSVYFIMPRFNSKFHELGVLGEPPILLLLQAPLLTLVIYLRSGRLGPQQAVILGGMILLLWACRMVGEPLADYASAGLFAFVTFLLLWPIRGRVAASRIQPARGRLAGHSEG